MRNSRWLCAVPVAVGLFMPPSAFLAPGEVMAQISNTKDKQKTTEKRKAAATGNDKPKVVKTKGGTIVVNDADSEPADANDVTTNENDKDQVWFVNSKGEPERMGVVSWVDKNGVVHSQITQEGIKLLEHEFEGNSGFLEVVRKANATLGARSVKDAIRLAGDLEALGHDDAFPAVVGWLDNPTGKARERLVQEQLVDAGLIQKGMIGTRDTKGLLRIAAAHQLMGGPGGAGSMTPDFVNDYDNVTNGRMKATEFIDKWALRSDSPWSKFNGGMGSANSRRPTQGAAGGMGGGGGGGGGTGDTGSGGGGGSSGGRPNHNDPDSKRPVGAPPTNTTSTKQPGGAPPTTTPDTNQPGNTPPTATDDGSGANGAPGAGDAPGEGDGADTGQEGESQGVIVVTAVEKDATGTQGTITYESSGVPGLADGTYVVAYDGAGGETGTGPSGETTYAGPDDGALQAAKVGSYSTGERDAKGQLIFHDPDSDEATTSDDKSPKYRPKDGGHPLPEAIALDIRMTFMALHALAQPNVWRGVGNASSSNTTPDPTSQGARKGKPLSAAEMYAIASRFQKAVIGNPGTPEMAAPREKPNLPKINPTDRQRPLVNPERDR